MLKYSRNTNKSTENNNTNMKNHRDDEVTDINKSNEWVYALKAEKNCKIMTNIGLELR